MEKEKIDKLIEAVADLSGLTPTTAALVAIKGECEASVAILGHRKDVVEILRRSMEKDARLKEILTEAVGEAVPERGNLSLDFLPEDFRKMINGIRCKAGRNADVFSIATGSKGIAIELSGKIGRLVRALKTAMDENPDIKELLEIVVKCDMDCRNCKVDHHKKDEDIIHLN